VFSEIIKYLSVYFLSMTKFVAGPSIGVVVGMPMFWTVVISVLGMMTSVMIFLLIGERRGYPLINRLVRYIRSRKGINDRFMYLWKRYGVAGVTFLTTVLFTPIIGTILVVAMGSPRMKVLVYMFFSAIFWSIALSKIASAVV